MDFLSIITRYFNEPYLDEFVEYYLHEGVDKIYVLYDVHSTMSISEHIKLHPKIEIYNSENFEQHELIDVNNLYTKIRDRSKWFMFIDIDEFITTKKNSNITIRRELITTFKDVDCVKIPWVMMACGSIKRDPPSLLQNLYYRWNHDLRHPHPNNWHKGRCRYNKIEVKCIFKSEKFDHITWHYPVNTANVEIYHKIKTPSKTLPFWGSYDRPNKINMYIPPFIFVDGVHAMRADINSYYDNLREVDISGAYLLCYHYRIISQESCVRKFTDNKIDRYKGDYKNLLLCDYPEVKDELLKEKSIRKFGIKTNHNNNFNLNKNRAQMEAIFKVLSIIQSNMMELTTFSQSTMLSSIEDKIKTEFEDEKKHLHIPFIKLFEDILTKQKSLSIFIKKKVDKNTITFSPIITEKEAELKSSRVDEIDYRPLSEITDCGYIFKPHGWYDALNQNRGNVDYGRWVGAESDPFWSVALNGVFNQLSSPGVFEQPDISILSRISDRKTNI